MASIRIEPETSASSNEGAGGPQPRRLKKRWVALSILLLLLAWVAYDLYGPRSTSMRSFDPNEVARLETAMWRSYYSRERVKLFTELSEFLRTQYNLPYVRSNKVAYSAAKAAFVFKDGQMHGVGYETGANYNAHLWLVDDVSGTIIKIEARSNDIALHELAIIGGSLA